MWNLSRGARRFRAADAIFVSVPKCGRTWVRAFLHAYFSARAEVETTWDEEALAELGAPRVAFTHDRWEQRATPRLWRKVRGADLIPPDRRRRGGIALLLRDPRDVLVSLYFQLTRREAWHRGDLAALVRHPRFGIASIVRAWNDWMGEWADASGFDVFAYEELHARPERSFRRLLALLGETQADARALEAALAFASFDNMRDLEREGAFAHGTLRPGDPADPDSFKMRRGEVGAFDEYLTESDLRVVAESLEALDPRLRALLGRGAGAARSFSGA